MTFVASLTLKAATASRVAAALGEDDLLGEQGIDISEMREGVWELAVYFEEKPARAVLARLEAVAESAGVTRARATLSRLPETNWVAKSLEGLKPVRAGRFLVHGRHDRDSVAPNDIGIEIEAGQAFGTGHHGTTVGCLLAIAQVAKTRRVRNALDVGTGSGVLAVAIARLCRAPVLASDIDPVAVAVARENFRLNGVGRFVRPLVATGLGNRLFAERGPFDLIVANILAGPLAALAPAIRRELAPGGIVILSGLLTHQRARVASAYRGLGIPLVRELRQGDWSTLVLARRG